MNSIHKIDNKILRLSINYPELRVEKPNIYLIRKEDGYLMIDCGGYDIDTDFELLCNTLHNLKIELKEIKIIFLTHTHKDHALLCGRFQQVSGAKVIMGKEDFLRLSGNIDLYRERYGYVKNYLSFWGYDTEMIKRFYRSFERQFYNAGLEINNIVLIDKDTHYGSVEVLYTPGHTAGSICIYDIESKILFSGDTLLKKIVTVPIIEYYQGIREGISLLSEHVKSLIRLKGINYEMICAGHGEPIKKDIPVVDTIFSYIDRRSKRVLSLIREGKDTVYKLALSLYSKDVFYEVTHKEAPVVYVSDLMMALEFLYQNNRIFVKDGVIGINE